MKLLSMKDICNITTLSRITIWRRVKEGKFPPPDKIGERRLAWHEEQVEKWIKGKRDWTKEKSRKT